MPTSAWMVIALVVVLDLIFLPIVLRLATRSTWRPIADAFPAVEPEPDAISKRWQGLSIGVLNLGFMFAITIDSAYLHVRPSPLGRLLALSPASVPWTAIEGVRKGRFFHKVRVGKAVITGPRWCLDLAFAED